MKRRALPCASFHRRPQPPPPPPCIILPGPFRPRIQDQQSLLTEWRPAAHNKVSFAKKSFNSPSSLSLRPLMWPKSTIRPKNMYIIWAWRSGRGGAGRSGNRLDIITAWCSSTYLHIRQGEAGGKGEEGLREQATNDGMAKTLPFRSGPRRDEDFISCPQHRTNLPRLTRSRLP
jgi:hypothetical protein